MSFTTALFWFFILIGVVIYYVLPSKDGCGYLC